MQGVKGLLLTPEFLLLDPAEQGVKGLPLTPEFLLLDPAEQSFTRLPLTPKFLLLALAVAEKRPSLRPERHNLKPKSVVHRTAGPRKVSGCRPKHDAFTEILLILVDESADTIL